MKRRRTSSTLNTHEGQNEAERIDRSKIEISSCSFLDLPKPIMANILVRLCVKRLLICKCVCKTWRDLISETQFAQLHFKQAEAYPMIRTSDNTRLSRILYLLQPEQDHDSYLRVWLCTCGRGHCKPYCSFHVNMKLESKFKLPVRNLDWILNDLDKSSLKPNPECKTKRKLCIKLRPRQHKYSMVNSCNGLLCLADPFLNEPVVVCNPVTGEFINLPEATDFGYTVDNQFQFDCGIGFSPLTKQYKVVKIFLVEYTFDAITRQKIYGGKMAEVHTLGTRSWKSIGSAPYSVYKLAFPTYLNGALHWIRLDSNGSDIIVAFDLDKECFKSFPPPSSFRHYYEARNKDVSLGVLEGRLCLCYASSCDSIFVWAMRQYGVKESWTELFCIDAFNFADRGGWPRGLYQPIMYLKNGVLLMFHYPRSALICYERGRGFKYLKVQGAKSRFEAIAHTPSLISLKDALSGADVQVLNTASRCAEFKFQGEARAFYLKERNRELEFDTDSDRELEELRLPTGMDTDSESS